MPVQDFVYIFNSVASSFLKKQMGGGGVVVRQEPIVNKSSTAYRRNL